MELFKKMKFQTLKLKSKYNHEKINNLYKNFDTMSFLDLLFNYNELIDDGYNKIFLDQALHTLLSLPFFFARNDGLSFNFNNECAKKE